MVNPNLGILIRLIKQIILSQPIGGSTRLGNRE